MSRLRIAFALVGAALLGLATLVLERWDQRLVEAFYLHPYGLLEKARQITLLGSLWVLGPLAGLVAAVLWRPGWRMLALRVPVVLAITEGLTAGLKYVVQRPRPEILAQADFSGPSFPSGHALDSLGFWFTLAQVVSTLWPEGGAPMLAIAAALTLLVGWSRLYLGIHWTSDVLSGWGFGLLVLAALPSPEPPKPSVGRTKARSKPLVPGLNTVAKRR